MWEADIWEGLARALNKERARGEVKCRFHIAERGHDPNPSLRDAKVGRSVHSLDTGKELCKFGGILSS